MTLDGKPFLKKALFLVAVSYLLYNIYQAVVTTVFLSHFHLLVTRLPQFIESSDLPLQLALFLLQEVMSSIGIYLRLIAGIFAVYVAFLFMNNDQRYLDKLSRVLLFESLYFALLIPAGINHVVGSTISSGALLNFSTGISFLLQAVLIFAPLFILSRKMRKPQNLASIQRWATIAAPSYLFGLWVKHGFMWLYALSPSGAQQAGLAGAVGFANFLLTLLVAAVLAMVASITWERKMILKSRWVGGACIFVGVYFVVYALVSVWVPVYLAFLPLTEFWMITVMVAGVSVLLVHKK